MSTTLRVLAWLDRAIQLVNAAVVALSLFLMFAVVFGVIVARFVFATPVFWGEELARYIMIYMALLGAAVALRSDQHPRLTLFAGMLPRAAQRVLARIIDVLLIVTIVVLFWHGLDIAREEGIMRTPALRIYYFWVFLAVPIGAAVMLLQLIARPFLPAIFSVTDDLPPADE